MTTEQLKDAMRKGVPVKHRDITYKWITAIIYRRTDHGVVVQAEMLDMTTNCVVLANPAEVEWAG